jgi:hypothetical protein
MVCLLTPIDSVLMKRSRESIACARSLISRSEQSPVSNILPYRHFRSGQPSKAGLYSKSLLDNLQNTPEFS